VEKFFIEFWVGGVDTAHFFGERFFYFRLKNPKKIE
jgi:hypothetical protein